LPLYSAYGLNIQSELPLPELAASEGEPRVTVAHASVDRRPTEVDETGHGFWAEGDEACHFFDRVGAFLVRGGREIIVDPVEGADASLVRLSIMGPALGLVLHQRGYLVLHASAIAIDGKAVAFVGWRGWGKSTLAAVLHGRGHAVISDDVTAVDFRGPAPSVLPGIPQIKLWPDAVTAMGDVPEDLPRLHPDFEKRALEVSRGFPREPIPLERVYVLATGPRPAIDSLPPVEAILELVRHWYGGRFGNRLLAIGNTAAEHLRQCGSLASSVVVRRLSRPRGAWSAESLADLVEADLKR
jgi:hypothetical protein